MELFSEIDYLKYMPPANSVLDLFLKTTQENILATKVWLAPESDPLTSACVGEPGPWYTNKIWRYVWRPFDQYRHLVDLKETKCFCCKKSGFLMSKGYRWRPMFNTQSIDWVLHQRMTCNDCGKSFSTIDHRFLAQLPTRVAERFPYIVPNSKGPGIHQGLIYMFANLATKQVMIGTFVNMINELYRTQYDRDRISYYDAAYERVKKTSENPYFQSFKFTEPFSTYDTPGEYGGLRLSRHLMKNAFLFFMRSHEEYMQTYFPKCSDEGVTVDHTFKYAKMISAPGGQEKYLQQIIQYVV